MLLHSLFYHWCCELVLLIIIHSKTILWFPFLIFYFLLCCVYTTHFSIQCFFVSILFLASFAFFLFFFFLFLFFLFFLMFLFFSYYFYHYNFLDKIILKFNINISIKCIYIFEYLIANDPPNSLSNFFIPSDNCDPFSIFSCYVM